MFLAALILNTLVILPIGWLIIRTIMRLSYKKRLFDEPDGGRKIHSDPVPRLGGLSIFPLITLVMAVSCLLLVPEWKERWISPWAEWSQLIGLGCSLLVLYILGINEDMRGGVRSLYKFIFYTVAAVVFIAFGLRFSYSGNIFGIESLPDWVWMLVTYVAFIHFLNAINLIDGVNGLSTDICIFSLSVLAVMEYMERHVLFTLLAIAAISVLLAFRWWNTHGDRKLHQRIFMGDTGCWTLGIIILFLIIHLNNLSPKTPGQHFSLLGFTTVIVPLLDLPRVGLWRKFHGIGFFVPDKNHIHHKLMDLGFEPWQIRGTILGLTAFFLLLNWLLAGHMDIGWIILIDVAGYLLFVEIIDLCRKRLTRKRKAPSDCDR